MRLAAGWGGSLSLPLRVLAWRCVASATFASATLGSAPRLLAEPAPRTLSFAESVRRASQDPPAVHAAIARLEQARANEAVASAAFHPTLRAEWSAGAELADQPYLPELRFHSTTLNARGELEASAALYDFGARAGELRAAEHRVDAAAADVDSARRSAALGAGEIYLTVSFDEEATAIARTAVQHREQQLEVVTALVEKGLRPDIDRTRSQMELEASTLALLEAETRRSIDAAALAVAVGFEPRAPLALEAVPFGAFEPDVTAAGAMHVVADRPEVVAARSRVAQAAAARDAAEARRWPVLSITLGGALQHTSVRRGLGLDGTGASAQASAVVSWNVFDATRDRVADERASQVGVANRELQEIARGVELETTQRALQADAARAALAQAQRMVASADQNRRMASERYRSGVAPLLEMLDAEQASLDVELSLARTRLALRVAQLRLLATTNADALVRDTQGLRRGSPAAGR